MKIITILLLGLFTEFVYGQEPFDAKAWQAPYDMAAPKDWGTEKFSIPIKFAPTIPYKGVEDIRFMPGWVNATSDEYWSYDFVWCLDGKVDIDAKTLESYLKIYYEGLAAATKSVPREKLISCVATNKKETICDNEKHFEGSVLMLDYMGQKPMTLLYKMHLSTCDNGSKTIMFFEISPKPLVHYVWQSLDKLRKDFKCKNK